MTIDEIKQALREMKERCANIQTCKECPLAVKGVCFATASSIEYHPHNISVIDGPAYPKKWTTEWDGGADDENA